jgi:hypothetical protein
MRTLRFQNIPDKWVRISKSTLRPVENIPLTLIIPGAVWALYREKVVLRFRPAIISEVYEAFSKRASLLLPLPRKGHHPEEPALVRLEAQAEQKAAWSKR